MSSRLIRLLVVDLAFIFGLQLSDLFVEGINLLPQAFRDSLLLHLFSLQLARSRLKLAENGDTGLVLVPHVLEDVEIDHGLLELLDQVAPGEFAGVG